MSKIILPDSDDELLAQCEIETFRASGSGGQHVNHTDSAVRLTYRGIVVTCQEERSQYRNKMRCLEKLREKVRRLNYRPPKRIPTKKPARAKRETLEKKTLHKMKKQMRGKIRGRSDEE